jgi:HSP20 family molecular chaperone IbpA
MRYYQVLEEKDIIDLIMDTFPEVKEEDVQINVVDGKVEITIPETDR